MPFFHIVILALVQGITEFLPISSSGHLVLAHALLGSDGTAQDQIMDIAVHVGTLAAVLLYFRQYAAGIVRRDAAHWRLAFLIVFASLPVIAAGFVMHKLDPAWSRSLLLMGWASIIFGGVLWYADKFRPAGRDLEVMSWKGALFIGLAQVLSLMPGVSRSGITMTAARWLGFSRTESARFSMMLAIVAISGAGALGGLDLLKSGDAALGLDALVAAVLSFVSSGAAIILMMKWLQHATFTPFVIYRIALGAALLAVYYGALS